MNLPLEQRQLLSAKATELADSIEAGTYKGPTPTNSHGWCGCAAGLVVEAAGMAPRAYVAAQLEELGGPEYDLTGITDEIETGEVGMPALVEPYRRIASRLLEAP